METYNYDAAAVPEGDADTGGGTGDGCGSSWNQ